MSQEKETSSFPFSILDVLLLGLGLFMFSQGASNAQAGNYLIASAETLLGLAGILFGLRSMLEYVLERDLSSFNQTAVAAAVVGVVLFLIDLLA